MPTQAKHLTINFVVAGDVADIDTAALTTALETELGCLSPCELRVTLSSGSVHVRVLIIVPVAAASTAADVADRAQSFASATPAALTAALSSALVTVASVSPAVAEATRVVMLKVAPPPPHAPPVDPSASPIALQSRGADSSPVIAACIAVACVVALALICRALLGARARHRRRLPKEHAHMPNEVVHVQMYDGRARDRKDHLANTGAPATSKYL